MENSKSGKFLESVANPGERTNSSDDASLEARNAKGSAYRSGFRHMSSYHEILTYAKLDLSVYLAHVFGLSASSAVACSVSAVKHQHIGDDAWIVVDKDALVAFLDQWCRGGQCFNATVKVLNAIERLGLRGHSTDGNSPYVMIGEFIQLLIDDSPLGLPL